MMIDPVTQGPHTYHTTNPVPFIVVDEDRRPLRDGGSLRDIAPTVLGLFGVKQPDEMTGRDLRTSAVVPGGVGRFHRAMVDRHDINDVIRFVYAVDHPVNVWLSAPQQMAELDPCFSIFWGERIAPRKSAEAADGFFELIEPARACSRFCCVFSRNKVARSPRCAVR